MYYTGIINEKQGKTMNKIKLIAGSLLLSSTLLVSGCDLDDQMMRDKGYDCHQIAEIKRILTLYSMQHSENLRVAGKDNTLQRPGASEGQDCWSDQGCIDLYYSTIDDEKYPLNVHNMYYKGYTVAQIENAQTKLNEVISLYSTGGSDGKFKAPPLSDLSGAYRSILNQGYNYDEPACPDTTQ